MTDDLASYLKARYAEIEKVARAAAELAVAPWTARHSENGEEPWDWELVAADGVPEIAACRPCEHAGGRCAVVEHIALHDPAAVLRDVEAKRAIVKECHETFVAVEGWEYAAAPDFALRTLLLLAQPFAGRNDFREQWRL
jgi:hypothetical protein